MLEGLNRIALSGQISHGLPILPSSGKFFSVKLPSPLAPGARVRVSVEMVFTHVLQPYPTHITQSEKQFVVFEGNHYFYSPYLTKTQTTRVKLASRNVESYTKLGNPARTEDTIEYGPFKDIPPYSQVNISGKQSSKRGSCVLGWGVGSRNFCRSSLCSNKKYSVTAHYQLVSTKQTTVLERVCLQWR